MVTRELRRAESWSRFQYAEVLQAANQAHRIDDVKRLRFVDPTTLVATNCAEIPTMSEQLRKESSALSRNANRDKHGQVQGGYIWQARSGPNYDVFEEESE
jgi:hypothetical protein